MRLEQQDLKVMINQLIKNQRKHEQTSTTLSNGSVASTRTDYTKFAFDVEILESEVYRRVHQRQRQSMGTGSNELSSTTKWELDSTLSQAEFEETADSEALDWQSHCNSTIHIHSAPLSESHLDSCSTPNKEQNTTSAGSEETPKEIHLENLYLPFGEHSVQNVDFRVLGMLATLSDLGDIRDSYSRNEQSNLWYSDSDAKQSTPHESPENPQQIVSTETFERLELRKTATYYYYDHALDRVVAIREFRDSRDPLTRPKHLTTVVEESTENASEDSEPESNSSQSRQASQTSDSRSGNNTPNTSYTDSQLASLVLSDFGSPLRQKTKSPLVPEFDYGTVFPDLVHSINRAPLHPALLSPQQLRCENCNEQFVSKTSLTKHYIIIPHQSDSLARCPFCSRLDRISEMWDHVQKYCPQKEEWLERGGEALTSPKDREHFNMGFYVRSLWFENPRIPPKVPSISERLSRLGFPLLPNIYSRDSVMVGTIL